MLIPKYNWLFFNLSKKVPGRMAMIVTLYLISAIVYNAVDAPSVRGFSNIEVWMLGAQFPILLALCEYGFVLYLKKYANKNQIHIQVQTMMPDQNQVQTTTHDQNQVQTVTPDNQRVKLDERIKRMDSTTMIFSFLFFTTFALIYWITLLTWRRKYHPLLISVVAATTLDFSFSWMKANMLFFFSKCTNKSYPIFMSMREQNKTYFWNQKICTIKAYFARFDISFYMQTHLCRWIQLNLFHWKWNLLSWIHEWFDLRSIWSSFDQHFIFAAQILQNFILGPKWMWLLPCEWWPCEGQAFLDTQ